MDIQHPPLLLAAIMNNGKLTSVDINPTTFTPPSEISNHHEFILSDSLKFLEDCISKKRKYDLIFVDDWHTYEHVKKELNLLSQIMDYGTVVLLHDLMSYGHAPYYWCTEHDRHKGGEWEGGGPFKAVYELDINEFEWATIPFNNGLTLLRKRSPYISD